MALARPTRPGAFTPTKLEPHRIQGSFFIRREDRASLAGMEEALRMNLSDAMSAKMDSEVIAGTVEGFLGSSGLTVRSGDAGTDRRLRRLPGSAV